MTEFTLFDMIFWRGGGVSIIDKLKQRPWATGDSALENGSIINQQNGSISMYDYKPTNN